MSASPVHLGVLVSGRGSNLEALLSAERAGAFDRARIVCVFSDAPEARGLDVARNFRVAAYAFRPRDYPSKADYEKAVISILESHAVEYLMLAGYMRIVGAALLARYPLRILNIHPSLLPSFPGLHAQRQALEHGARFSGCTVHFADAGVDAGPIIAQRVVPVLPGDTEDTLSARILEQEHQLFTEAVKLVTERPWEIHGRTVMFS
ncbi:MAG: phosphoribosylglycinamide formyltransferase [Candidatus Sumerlaeota bacterium]|nr:phosphoribosylglycinamide formyltransferase [Candidatus Sumerlaeota bacterium]